MPKPASPKYRTTNWSAYNAALKQRGSLDIWFDPDMQWLSAPCGRPGRPARFTDSAIELCLTLKAHFNLSLRQVMGLVASLLKLAELDWPVPDYTTLCRRQKTLPVTLGGRHPPGTSKWNRIEHRLFAFITQNWRGKPLISHEVIIQLIGATTTDAGLDVQCCLDENDYPKAIKVSDGEIAAINLHQDAFHGEWNYTISPFIA